MKNKNLILILLAIGAGAFFLMKKRQTAADFAESSEIPPGGGSFELPPEYIGKGGGVSASPVVPFNEPVSSFIPAGSSNLKPPTSLTEMPQTPQQLTAIADDIRQKWFRWKNLLDKPIIVGTINSDYTIAPGPPIANPIYSSQLTRNSLNTPLPNIALIPNLMTWFWNNTKKVWEIMERTA